MCVKCNDTGVIWGVKGPGLLSCGPCDCDSARIPEELDQELSDMLAELSARINEDAEAS